MAALSVPCSTGRSRTYSSPPRHLADLTVETNRLLESSMSSNTWQTYSTAIGKFNQFRYLYGLPLDGLPPVDQVVQFIAYMSACNCTPSTIRTYISGLSFWYKVQGREDVTKAFIVTKLLEGAKRGAGTQDNRVPITLNILTK